MGLGGTGILPVIFLTDRQDACPTKTVTRRTLATCCHCEERSDEAISLVQSGPKLRLLRFARNDKTDAACLPSSK